MRCLQWDVDNVPQELIPVLQILGDEFPVRNLPGAANVRFRPGLPEDSLSVSAGEIAYGSLRSAGRGIGLWLAGLTGQESCFLETTGIMLDCSRNAVPHVQWLKRWLCRMFLYGYNRVMLYTEDTYQLPEEPVFGYCRGGYTGEELRELDDFAFALGIELIPCIQTLGHLEQLLKLPEYGAVADTEYNLLVDEEKTYELIRRMLQFWKGVFRSGRIHIGMDEVHKLGRGAFLDRHGYEQRLSIFVRHLTRVRDMCREFGYDPMIWSDMYFRTRNPQMNYYYYTDHFEPSENDRVELPKDIQLVYWDYYHWEEKIYLNMIHLHRELGYEPVMASSVWTFPRLWYDRDQTEKTIRGCVQACRTAGLKEIFFAMWGDDGAFCDFDSAEAGLLFAMEKIWSRKESIPRMQKLYAAVSGGDYRQVCRAARMQVPQPAQFTGGASAGDMLWDDPLLGIFYRYQKKKAPRMIGDMYQRVLEIETGLKAGRNCTGGGDLVHARNLCRVVRMKIELRKGLEEFYQNPRKEKLPELIELAEKKIPRAVRALQLSFRRQWLRRNKPFGLEVIQIRIAGLAERSLEVARRLRTEQPEQNLPELAEKAVSGYCGCYRQVATACRFI